MRLVCVLIFCLIAQLASGQEANSQSPCDPKKIFLVTEQLSEYKDGQDALIDLLNEKVDLSRRVKGVIHLKFLVDCQGKATDFTLMRGTHKDVGRQIVAVLEENQGFNPAQQKGKPVNSFKLMQLDYHRGKFLHRKK